MPYVTQWLIEDQIILNLMMGKLNADDARQGTYDTIALANSSDNPAIHVINDSRFLHSTSVGIGEARELARESLAHLTGWTIMINNNQMVNFLASAAMQIAGKNFRTFTSPTEALNHVRAIMPEYAEILHVDHYNAMVRSITEAHDIQL